MTVRDAGDEAPPRPSAGGAADGRSAFDRAVLAAVDASDDAALDDAIRAHPVGVDALLPLLLERAPEDGVAAARALLGPTERGIPRFDVGGLLGLGRLGLWVATEWALEVIPERERLAPVPSFERWDALVELHVGRAETPWLVLLLFGRLSGEQASLGRRALIGYRRRFGDRGAALGRHVLDRTSMPLADLLRATVDLSRDGAC